MTIPADKHELCAANFRRLQTLCEDLNDLPANAKSEVRGYMALCIDRLDDDNEHTRIALAHYFKQNGDLVPAPDMEIVIHKQAGLAEAVTFQNSMIYDEGYEEDGERISAGWPGMQDFLAMWLKNLIEQGHRIAHAPAPTQAATQMGAAP